MIDRNAPPAEAIVQLLMRLQQLGSGEPSRRSWAASVARVQRAPLRAAWEVVRALGAGVKSGLWMLGATLLRVLALGLLATFVVPAALWYCGAALRPPPATGRLPISLARRLVRGLRELGGRFVQLAQRLWQVLTAPIANADVVLDVMRWLLGRQKTLPLFAPLLHRAAPILALPKAFSPHGFGLTLVLGYDDVEESLGNDASLRVSTYNTRMTRTSGPFLLGHDGDDHKEGRGRASRAVRDGRHEHDGPQVVRLARECSQRLVAMAAARSTPSIDVVSELGNAVPLYVAREYFGVEDTEDEALLPLLQTMSFYLFNFWIGGPYEVQAVAAGERLRRILRRQVDDRLSMAEPPDDVLQRVLLQTAADFPSGARLPDEEREKVASHLLGLLSGSIVATIGTFLNAVRALLELPASRLAELQTACTDDAHPERLDHWVREACRIGGSFPPALYRVASDDVELSPSRPHRKLVARGSYVVNVQWLANFDPQKYRRAWRLRPERFEVPPGAPPCPLPLLFGAGVHRCLAEHLGHAIIVEMIRALFAQSGVRRADGAEGKLQPGPKGEIPYGNFAQRMVLCFDPPKA